MSSTIVAASAHLATPASATTIDGDVLASSCAELCEWRIWAASAQRYPSKDTIGKRPGFHSNENRLLESKDHWEPWFGHGRPRLC
jgi:hypothetical protein